MYEIVMIDGSVRWFNERIIMKIYTNNENELILEHFNNSTIVIKSFKKL